MTTATRDDLFRLLEALCEERLDQGGAAQLERMVLDDPDARRMFVEYLSLHGLLYWDAAPEAATLDIESILRLGALPAHALPRRAAVLRIAVSVAACLLVLVGAFIAGRGQPRNPAPLPDNLAQDRVLHPVYY